MLISNKNISYTLPSAWREVTLQQLCDLERLQLNTVGARASYFAGQSVEINECVAEALTFLQHEPPKIGGLLSKEFDLGQYSYLQVETMYAAVAGGVAYSYLPEVYGIVAPRPNGTWSQEWAAGVAVRCLGYSVSEVYPVVAHCLTELKRLSDKYAKLTEPDHTEAADKARSAGVDRLNIFSHLNVARHYAERFGSKLDEIYMRPWEEITLMLYQDRITSEVQDQLNKQSQR